MPHAGSRMLSCRLAILAALLAGACTRQADSAPPPDPGQALTRRLSSNPTGCVDGFDRHLDYFPDKSVAHFANLFGVSYHGHYKVLTVRFKGFTDNPRFESTETYVLVQCGTPTPALTGPLAGSHVVRVPAQSVTVTTNEDLGLITALGLESTLKSVGSRSIYPQGMWDRVRTGTMPVTGGWGAEGAQLELLTSLAPDVVIIGAFHSEASTNMRRVRQTGLSTAPSLVRVEPTPLGRAEWLKAVALFFNLEQKANGIVEEVASRYQTLSAAARRAEPKPRAFWGSTYDAGDWGVGRNNFQARLIEDAGAVNALADTGPTHVVRVGAEVVVAAAGDADIWITEGRMNLPGSRPGDLKARRNGGTYYVCRGYRKENAGCEYYHTAPHRPDVMLADLVSVFHPGMRAAHAPFFLISHAEVLRRGDDQ